jgi:hypothetical protein
VSPEPSLHIRVNASAADFDVTVLWKTELSANGSSDSMTGTILETDLSWESSGILCHTLSVMLNYCLRKSLMGFVY